MRPPLLASVACGLFLLGACATTPAAHLAQGRADAAAWDALHGVASSLGTLARNRQITGDKAAQAKVVLDAANRALTQADQAYRQGADATAAQNVATAAALTSQLVAIVAATQGH